MLHLTNDPEAIQQYLSAQGWLNPDETVRKVEVPGAGNMNFTLRVITDQRTFIIKQSRDYVEKYPQVAAPAERAAQEAAFYQLIGTQPSLKALMPDLQALDEANNIIMMEDLGAGTDYSYLYQAGEVIPAEELLEIMDFAARLHNSFSARTTTEPIRNRKMRALNHEHIFYYPYLANNGLDLDTVLPGLGQVAQAYKEDQDLQTRVKQLGEKYLSDGPVLLHGDYFPGSWLRTAEGVRIIDPEFCFFGFPEFEIGVTLAHLKMADQPAQLIEQALEHYTRQAALDEALCRQFTAIEILRRILGLAQLPLTINLTQRQHLLTEARTELMNH